MTLNGNTSDPNITRPVGATQRISGPLSASGQHRVRLAADGRPKTITRPHPDDCTPPPSDPLAGQSRIPPRPQYTMQRAIREANQRVRDWDTFGCKYQMTTTICDALGQPRATITITGRADRGVYATWGNHLIVGHDLITMRQRVLARWPEADTTPWEFVEFFCWD